MSSALLRNEKGMEYGRKFPQALHLRRVRVYQENAIALKDLSDKMRRGQKDGHIKQWRRRINLCKFIHQISLA